MLTHGLIQLYTGNGKGKTSAGVGAAVRAHGAGLRVAFIQFVKGGAPSSELAVLRELGIRVERPAVATTGLLRKGVTDEDYAAARAAWTLAAEALLSGDYDVVICDELNIALHNRLLAEADVVQTLKARPAHVEVIITGRHAPEALWALADYVTEMTLHKHPFTAGRGARKGIEM